MKPKGLLFLMGILLVCWNPAVADTHVVAPWTQGTMTNSTYLGGNYVYGITWNMWVGWDSDDQIMYGLLDFDLSGVPSGKYITRAELWICDYYNSLPPEQLPQYVDVHSATNAWNAATESWNSYIAKGSPGYAPAILGTLEVEQINTFHFDYVSSRKMAEAVQGWVDDPNTNHGLLLRYRASNAGYWAQFINEWKMRPFLIVGYSDTPPSPAACGDVDHPYAEADLNTDCHVNFGDFAKIAANWGLSVDPGTVFEEGNPSFSSVTVNPDADTSLRDDTPDTNYGTWSTCFVIEYYRGADSAKSRILQHYNMPTLPLGSNLAYAELSMYNSLGHMSLDDLPVELRVLYTNWVAEEATLTWNTFGVFPGGLHGVDFGDEGESVGQLLATGPANVWEKTPVDVDVIRGWYRAPNSNKGLILMNADHHNSAWLHYAAREWDSYPPKLKIWYTDLPMCGDVNHPYPVGDFDKNCTVDITDLSVVIEKWLSCNDPAGGC
ncbi:MAG: DNRLRE domain-containing protein [Planctomycetota bacterium]